ncbi:sugar transporter SWEET1 [Arctopsyche grandis]|uniref:sugar transporter SWEET1 n=1 Tax=Arctopsyche grandis TaxID=121162 RepID=UPI00406DA28E
MSDWQVWKAPVAAAAVITTVVQFLAGTIVCRKYVQKGTAGESSGFPFVCGILLCGLWHRYGWLKGDNSIILVNSIGVLLQLSYVFVYYRYTIRKSIVLYQVLAVFTILGIVYSYTLYETNEKLAIERTGLISSVVTLIFIAAPLTMLLHVMQVRSTETLPFPIILMSSIVSILWFLYGLIVEDPFMVVTNAIGAILAVCQLFLFVIYPNKTSYNRLNQIM